MRVPSQALANPTPSGLSSTASSAAGLAPARSRGGFRRLASGFFTGLLVLLVVGVLALGVGPQFLPYRTYTVLSGSMEPTIHVGAVVVAVPADGSTLRVGDIITVNRPGHAGEHVTHRIYRVEDGPKGLLFITKGDANGAPDAWVVSEKDSGSKYLFSVPWAGYALNLMQTPTGRLLFVLAPALLLALVFLTDLWRPRSTEAPAGR